MNEVKGTNNKVLYDKLQKYQEASDKFKKSRNEAEAKGYDALMKWYEDGHEKPEYPLTGGQSKALRLILWNCAEELVLNDGIWDEEVHDFIETLRDEGAETFVVTDNSTALMRNMHAYASEGCKMLGLCEVNTGMVDYAYGEEKPEVKQGVRFAL